MFYLLTHILEILLLLLIISISAFSLIGLRFRSAGRSRSCPPGPGSGAWWGTSVPPRWRLGPPRSLGTGFTQQHTPSRHFTIPPLSITLVQVPLLYCCLVLDNILSKNTYTVSQAMPFTGILCIYRKDNGGRQEKWTLKLAHSLYIVNVHAAPRVPKTAVLSVVKNLSAWLCHLEKWHNSIIRAIAVGQVRARGLFSSVMGLLNLSSIGQTWMLQWHSIVNICTSIAMHVSCLKPN